MFAHLSWYNFSILKTANDEFWNALRIACLEINPNLMLEPDRKSGLDTKDYWEKPDCFFTQACGYDLIFRENLPLVPIAAPVLKIPGCEEHLHRSFLLVHEKNPAKEIKDLKGMRAAINCKLSNTGMNLLRHTLAPVACQYENFLQSLEVSGSHRESISMLKKNRVDLVSVDCLTFHYLKAFEPEEVSGLRVFSQSSPCPIPPFCTSVSTSVENRNTLIQALNTTMHSHQNSRFLKVLGFQGIKRVSKEDYLVLKEYKNEADRLGYSLI